MPVTMPVLSLVPVLLCNCIFIPASIPFMPSCPIPVPIPLLVSVPLSMPGPALVPVTIFAVLFSMMTMLISAITHVPVPVPVPAAAAALPSSVLKHQQFSIECRQILTTIHSQIAHQNYDGHHLLG